MKISIGMGFLRKPELAVLSPLSLAVSMLTLELLLPLLSSPLRSKSSDFLSPGLRGNGTLEGEDLGEELERGEEEDDLEDFFGDAEEELLLLPMLKRSIQDEADWGKMDEVRIGGFRNRRRELVHL